MAQKKYKPLIGAGFGSKNLGKLVRTLSIFWGTLSKQQQSSWKTNRVSEKDLSGQFTMFACFLQRYASSNVDHWKTPFGTVSMRDESKKVFADRRDQGFSIS